MVKLSTLKQTKIRCLVVEDSKGKIKKITDRDKIKKTLDLGNKNVIEVYNPTQEQKLNIIKMLEEQQVEDKIVVEGELIVGLIKELTNIEIDLDDMDLVQEIVNNPNNMLEEVSSEINQILYHLISMQFKNISAIAELPTELLAATLGKDSEKTV